MKKSRLVFLTVCILLAISLVFCACAPTGNNGDNNGNNGDNGGNEGNGGTITTPTKTVVELLEKAGTIFNSANVALKASAVGVGAEVGSELAPASADKPDEGNAPLTPHTLDNLEGYVLMASVSNMITTYFDEDNGMYSWQTERFKEVEEAYATNGGAGRVTLDNGTYYEKATDGNGYVVGQPWTKGQVGEETNKDDIIAYGESTVSVEGNTVIFNTQIIFKDIVEGYEEQLQSNTTTLVPYYTITVDGDKAECAYRTAEGKILERIAVVKMTENIYVETYFSQYQTDSIISGPAYVEGMQEAWIGYVDDQRAVDQYSVPDEPYIVGKFNADGSIGHLKVFRNYSHDVSDPDAEGRPTVAQGNADLPTSWLTSFDADTVMDLGALEGDWASLDEIYLCQFNYEKLPATEDK